jgi:hypothetical protein
METTSPATAHRRFKGIGRAAQTLGTTSQWLRIVLKNPERGPELHRRYLDYQAGSARAIDLLTKLEDLDIVSRLRELEAVVAHGDVPKKQRPRFAALLWELEKQADLFPHSKDDEPAPQTEADWQPVPPPAPAPPDPVAEAIRAIRERQQAESSAVIDRAIQALLQRPAGPAAKPLSADTPTQEHREAGPVPMAASPAPAIGSAD